jgi:hypothetical protein
MKSMLRPLHLLALACLVVTLAGCSSGSARGPVTAGARNAPVQVASALFVQQWGQILWGLVTSQTATGTPSFGAPVFNPDGSVSQTYTGADGTEAVLTALPDGTVTLDITYPDGTTQNVLQGVPEFDGVSVTTTDWEVTSSDGLSVTYTSVVDDQGTIFDISDDTTELRGSSALPDDLTQEFTVVTAGGQTSVQAEQSDGSTFTLNVPLAPPEFGLPDFSQPSTGTYSGAGFDTQFTLSSTAGAPSRWASMTSDLGGGLTGEFSLDAGFAGSGQFSQDQELAALVSWTQTGETQVSSVTAERSDTSPAGAALDYLTHRWQTLAALFAPAPGVAAAQLDPRAPARLRTLR